MTKKDIHIVWEKELWIDEIEHQFVIFCSSMSTGMDIHIIVGDEVDSSSHETIFHIHGLYLIAGYH